MRYRVIAPLVIAHDQQGSAHHKYAGQVLPWLSAKERDHLLDMGMVEELTGAADPDEGQGDDGAGGAAASGGAPNIVAPQAVTPDTVARPLQVARKEAWVDYAVHAHRIDQAEAEAMTLDQLKALPSVE